ncbi:MAG: hypothetical protein ABH827_05430 [bacterium]
MTMNVELLKEYDEMRERSFFYKMLCPDSVGYTHEYLKEEEQLLHNFVAHHTSMQDMNFIVVGAGPLLHLSLGYEHARRYVAVDPIADQFLNDSMRSLIAHDEKIKIFNKPLEALEKHEVPVGNSLYVFTFNVVSYIKDFGVAINNVIRKGDVLFISYWNNTKENEELIFNYFDFVYGKDAQVFRRPLLDTGDIDYKNNKFFKRAEQFCGKVVKTIIVYT